MEIARTTPSLSDPASRKEFVSFDRPRVVRVLERIAADLDNLGVVQNDPQADKGSNLFDCDWIREGLEGLLIGMDQSASEPALDLFQLRAGPEHDRIFGDFARTRVDDQLIRNETLVDLFRQTARDHAARTAIECGGESLSYRELDRRASA